MPTLYVVATPIGNLSDLTPRAAEALKNADLIASEDTRVTMKLLAHLGITKPMTSCHQHNEQGKRHAIVGRMLEEGIDVALTCDAGTPGISDPGSLLVAAAWEAGIDVIPVCGASAVATAISASGFEAREFTFYGFLPREKKPLREKLAAIRKTMVPIAVLYESPHRVTALAKEIAGCLPGSRLAVCCDLSKRYEKIIRGDSEQVAELLERNPNTEKGEYCLVLDMSQCPEPPPEQPPIPAEARLLMRLLEGEELRDAAQALMAEGVARNEVYRAKMRVKEMFEE